MAAVLSPRIDHPTPSARPGPPRPVERPRGPARPPPAPPGRGWPLRRPPVAAARPAPRLLTVVGGLAARRRWSPWRRSGPSTSSAPTLPPSGPASTAESLHPSGADASTPSAPARGGRPAGRHAVGHRPPPPAHRRHPPAGRRARRPRRRRAPVGRRGQRLDLRGLGRLTCRRSDRACVRMPRPRGGSVAGVRCPSCSQPRRQGRRLAPGRRRHHHPSPSRVPGLRPALHHLRAPRGGPARGGQALRRPGAVRPGQDRRRASARPPRAARSPTRRSPRPAADLEDQFRLAGPEITSEQVGLAVLERLRDLDQVAYVRFASVYKGFDDPADFQREVRLLKATEPKRH